MTRETKFALIIGFTLILVVGVLITDHFSGANRSSIADVSGLDGARSSSMPIEPLVAVNDLTGLPEHAPAPARETPPPVVLDQRRSGFSGPETQGGFGPGTSPWSDPGAPPPRGGGEPSRGADPLWNDPRFTPVDEDERRTVPGAGTREQQPPAGSGTSGSGNAGDVTTPPAGQPPQPLQPALDTPVIHVVTARDSLYDLAKKYYGKGSMWPKLAAANPGKVGKEGAIREGSKLSIPAVLDGVARRGSGTPAAQGQTPVAPPVNPPAEPGKPRKYTVVKGDTLGIIAKRELGSAKRVEEILELNPDIEDEDTIYLGMVITLPAKK